MRFSIRFMLISLVLLALAESVCAQAQEPVHARTDAGKDVILFPDGTWKYGGTAAVPPPPPAAASPARRDGKSEFKTTRGSFSVWVDTDKWKLSPRTASPVIEYQFVHKDGDCYAIIIPERISMTLDDLKEIVLAGAKQAAPDLKLVSEEAKVVNGHDLIVMKTEGTIKGIPFTYLGYYYTGEGGTLQVITYAPSQFFKTYEADLGGFLSGVELH